MANIEYKTTINITADDKVCVYLAAPAMLEMLNEIFDILYAEGEPDKNLLMFRDMLKNMAKKHKLDNIITIWGEREEQ